MPNLKQKNFSEHVQFWVGNAISHAERDSGLSENEEPVGHGTMAIRDIKKAQSSAYRGQLRGGRCSGTCQTTKRFGA